jgi:hypothetical protein
VPDHPFFAVSGKDGSFTEVAAGDLHRSVHEKFGRQTQQVTIAAKDRRTSRSHSRRNTAVIDHRTKLPLHLFSMLVAASTAALIFAGGMVTSTGSGLAVRIGRTRTAGSGPSDSALVGGIFYEHTHRPRAPSAC